MKLKDSLLRYLAVVGMTLAPTMALAADYCGPDGCQYADAGIVALVNQLGITMATASDGGVQVTRINDPDGQGASYGLEVGDVIVGANDTETNTLHDLVDAVAFAQMHYGGEVILLVRDVRTGDYVYLDVFVQ